MKKYFLYWGCSLESSGANFLVSLKPVAKKLGIEFEEIEDWNCCGASVTYVNANDLSLKVINARNLAIAEKQGSFDIVAPCSACYIQMNKVNHEMIENPGLAKDINTCLAVGSLEYGGTLKVRHILDVLYNDIGTEIIKQMSIKPLQGIKVAAYMGCQTTRPYGEYDSVERPVVHDKIVESLGAAAVPFPQKMRCCGSGIFLPEIENCMPMVKDILADAISNGAQIISTVCPMCAMNLENYQKTINKALGTNFRIPVVYLTQLMAIAFGMDPKTDAALHYNIIPPEEILLRSDWK